MHQASYCNQYSRYLVQAAALLLLALIAVATILALQPALQLSIWWQLAGDARLWRSIVLGVWVAVASTALALALTFSIGRLLCARANSLASSLPWLLALPHAALALGFSLLIMPSGWFARLLAPLFGWQRPVDLVTVGDPYALSLIGALALKEAPFLLWVLSAQWHSRSSFYQQQLNIAASLGYNQKQTWRYLLWPQLLPQLRWALLAVLAYSLSSVEMALILGPNTPPPLAVLSWNWLNDASRYSHGSAAVVIQIFALMSAAALLLLYQRWLAASCRGRQAPTVNNAQPGSNRQRSWLWLLIIIIYLAVAAALLVAASSSNWRYPQLLPANWRLSALERSLGSVAIVNTLSAAALASALACALVLLWLQHSRARSDRYSAYVLFGLLITPPLLLASGFYQLLLRFGLSPGFNPVWLAHCLWILPYSWLVLQPAWRSYDKRYQQIAASFGKSNWQFIGFIKLPMLRAPITAALAVGVAVSVAQYLPTQFLGAGRVATVTTETVTLAAGGQRSLAAAYAFWQALLPVVAFYCASRFK